MQATIDSEIMEVEGLTEERAKIQKQITETIEKNSEGNNLLFRPLLLGTNLHAIYNSIINAQNEIGKNRRGVIQHLAEIIAIQNNLVPYLTGIHREPLAVIVNNEFQLIQLIINSLSNPDNSISEIWQDFSAIEEIFRALLTQENQQEQQVINLLASLQSLYKNLNERFLTDTYDEIVRSWEEQVLSIDSEKSFQEQARPVIEHLMILLNKAEQHSCEGLKQNIDSLLNKIKLLGLFYIKQDVDKQIQLINADPWAKITEKKKLYCDLIPKIKQLCLETPEIDQTDLDLYCKQLFAGFELTREATFLDLIALFGKVFFSTNVIKSQYISEYIESAKGTVITTVHADDGVKSILKKRVHFSNENQVRLIEGRNKTQPQYSNEPSTKKHCTTTNNSTQREIAEKFINILDPVVSETGLSRRFAVAILIHIAGNIRSLTTETSVSKLFMEFDILMGAKDLCPEDATELLKDLDDKIQIIQCLEKNRVALHSRKKYAQLHNPADHNQPAPSVITRFKAILVSLIEEIDAATPARIFFEQQMHSFIDLLFIKIKDDRKQRINEKNLQKIQMPFMAVNTNHAAISEDAPEQKNTTHYSKQLAVPRSYTRKARFVSLLDAMLHANSPEDFKTYLADIKRNMEPTKYLDFLIVANKSDFTPLHTVLHDERFDNYELVPIYLNEVKQIMNCTNSHSFSEFLVSQTTTGLTFLHLVARCGDFRFVKNTIEDFKQELTASEYARALRIESNFGFYPQCPPRWDSAFDINEFLRTERYQNPVIRNNSNCLFGNYNTEKPSSESTDLSIQFANK